MIVIKFYKYKWRKIFMPDEHITRLTSAEFSQLWTTYED